MWTRRIRKKLVTAWVMRPIHRDRWATRLAAGAARATRGPVRKVAWLAGGLCLTIALALTRPAAAIVPALVLVALPVWYGAGLARRARHVRQMARRGWSTAGAPAAWRTLGALGVDERTQDRLIAASQDGDVLIGAFDQDNRLRSEIGPIPLLACQLVGAEGFRPRARHTLDLVVARGVVCVRKTYADRASFTREALALDALAGLAGVPQVVAVRTQPPTLYQSFLTGQNVGSLMAAAGAPVSVQYRVSIAFEQPDRWSADNVAGPRAAALAALRASVPRAVLTQAAELMDRIHERGVIIRDVKYGNLLVTGGAPLWCDFDGAAIRRPTSWRSFHDRAADREQFDYFFGGPVLTERRFRTAVAQLAAEKPDLFYAPIYYGHGSESSAPGSIELGSGKWHFIRPYLPDLAGKRVLDLGCNNALLPLEMLRAGARGVTAYELNPVFARYARLNHRWFEFVDNRRYPGFELIEGYMHEACEHDWTGYDIASAFCSLYYETPEQMARIVRTLSATAEYFIVQANENAEEHDGELRERASLPFLSAILRDNGYPKQRLVRFPYYDRPLVIGRRG